MTQIRDFCNADLPELTRVWSEHWTAAESPPAISTTIIERAILSRTFFLNSDLIIAEVDGSVEAWCHISRPGSLASGQQESEVHCDGEEAIISAICFTQAGLECCDELLAKAQQRVVDQHCRSIAVGPVRDQLCGFAGIPPIGHGIGIPDVDVRSSSLLSRHGFSPSGSFQRMVVTTAPYKPPVNREMMQLRRSTRTDRSVVVPQSGRYASAMAHLDIEHHQLINHRTGERLANMRLWMSDQEAQVMSCAEAILDLSAIESQGQLNTSESFLIAAMVQSMAPRCVFRMETAINAEFGELQKQLETLQFQCTGRGSRWTKSL